MLVSIFSRNILGIVVHNFVAHFVLTVTAVLNTLIQSENWETDYLN
jgi:hypothetical protein